MDILGILAKGHKLVYSREPKVSVDGQLVNKTIETCERVLGIIEKPEVEY